ncbi:hypothetical protein FB451DRAFT_1166919 [Mycena latifolia]|nr:hypothetical protein FB451DRAFT_1166919 [Mycena latifolia]
MSRSEVTYQHRPFEGIIEGAYHELESPTDGRCDADNGHHNPTEVAAKDNGQSPSARNLIAFDSPRILHARDDAEHPAEQERTHSHAYGDPRDEASRGLGTATIRTARKSRRVVEAGTTSAEGVSDAAQLATALHPDNQSLNSNPGLRLTRINEALLAVPKPSPNMEFQLPPILRLSSASAVLLQLRGHFLASVQSQILHQILQFKLGRGVINRGPGPMVPITVTSTRGKVALLLLGSLPQKRKHGLRPVSDPPPPSGVTLQDNARFFFKVAALVSTFQIF